MAPKSIESLTEPVSIENAWRAAREADKRRVAIIGAGPLGIEAAHYGLQAGLTVRIFEREAQIASTVRPWQHLSLFTPWRRNRTPLGERILQGAQAPLPRAALYHTGADLIGRYLSPLAAALPSGVLELDTRVVGIGRAYTLRDDLAGEPLKRCERRFRVLTRRGGNGEERVWSADYVLECSGGGRVPAWVGAGGLPAIGEMGCAGHIFHFPPDIHGRDRIHFLGKSTLLVGDGPSAASSAVALAGLHALDQRTSFAWAMRTSAEMPYACVPADPLPHRDLLHKKANLLVKKGAHGMHLLRTTQVEAVRYLIEAKRFYVTLQVGEATRRIVFDSIIANVGTRPQPSYQRELIHGEMNFFPIGGLTRCPDGSDFLLFHGHRQIRDAYRAITGDASLDLYAGS